MERIKVYEVFYGWKAGSNEIDEKGNTRICVVCEGVEGVINEIELLISTEKNKKRGKLKELYFTAGNTDFLLKTGLVETALYIDYHKPHFDTDFNLYSDIVDGLQYLYDFLKVSIKYEKPLA